MRGHGHTAAYVKTRRHWIMFETTEGTSEETEREEEWDIFETWDKTIKKGKNKMKSNLEKIKFDGIKFQLVNNYSEEQLFQKIKNIVDFKFTDYKESSDNIPTP